MMCRRIRLALLALLPFAACGVTFAAEAKAPVSPINYKVFLESPAQHLLRVRIQIPPGLSQRDFQLPVWNATYQVRDFAQYVLWLHAKAPDSSLREAIKLNKSLWRVDGLQHGGEIEYELFAGEPGPFGAELTADHAFFNLAEILMYPADSRWSPMSVKFENVPEGWRTACALPEQNGELHAPDYDSLVDSPVELGKFRDASFLDAGGEYRIVIDAAPETYDLAALQETVRKIVHTETTWMEDRPFQRYLFIYHFAPDHGGGGMEHANSTAIELSATTMQSDPRDFSSVTAHEFFHLWNVKRIRPQSLAPPDYTKENYTRALWFSEGVTSTVGDYALLQAGLTDEPAFLRSLSSEITELEVRPAHTTQSAEESSLDAWLEKYPSYRQPDHSVSYYNKGFLLGVMLDLAMRKASQDDASLQNLFVYLNQAYAKKGKFFAESAALRQAAEAVSGADFATFFSKYVAGVEEIPYDEFLSWVGLRVVAREKIVADPGFQAARNFDTVPIVVSVTPGSDAERNGLTIGDQLLSIDGVAPDQSWDAKIRVRNAGEYLRLRVRGTGGTQRELSWKLAARKTLDYEVVDTDNVTQEQKLHRKSWLQAAPKLKPSVVAPANQEPLN